MKLRDLGVTVLPARAGLLVEHFGKLLDRLSLPGCNRGRMQFVLRRQLRNRLVAQFVTVTVPAEECSQALKRETYPPVVDMARATAGLPPLSMTKSWPRGLAAIATSMAAWSR